MTTPQVIRVGGERQDRLGVFYMRGDLPKLVSPGVDHPVGLGPHRVGVGLA